MIKKQSTQKKKMNPVALRKWLIIATIVLVAALTAVNVWLAKTVKVEQAVAEQQQDKSYGEAAIGGDFTAVDHTGAPFTFSQTGGKFRLVFFGFTNCPMICPTSLATLSAMQDALGEEASKITPVFVSVDNKRDTPEVINSYISSFHPSIIGVTGSDEQIKAAADAFKVFYSVGEPMMDGGYMVDHSTFIYLMDGEGNYLKHFPYNVELDVLLNGVKEVL